MRLLLDTDVLLWTIEGTLPPDKLEMIYDERNALYFSLASVWEGSMKAALGKFNFPRDLIAQLPGLKIDLLPIASEHVLHVRDLPLLHGDPFDRLLVAQAILEALTIVTHDRKLAAYACKTLLV